MQVKKEFIEIGGIKQGMIIDECSDLSAPVALFIHGGPGAPEHIMLANILPQLNDFMTTCYHEQRGSSLSYDKKMPNNLLTTAQIIDDCIEVIDYLCEKYQKDKIIIIGHSWGTYVGYQLIQVYPEKVHAYVGIGQIGHQFDGEWDTVNYLLEKTKGGELPKVRQVLLENQNNIDFVRSKKYLQNIRSKGLNHFGGGLTAESDKTLNKQMLKAMWQYPHYTWGEKWRYLSSSIKNMKPLMQLFDEVLSTDLVADEVTVDVPFYIFQGKYDYQTSYQQAVRLFERTHAPFKKFVTFEEGAHGPMIEAPEKYRAELQSVVENIKDFIL